MVGAGDKRSRTEQSKEQCIVYIHCIHKGHCARKIGEDEIEEIIRLVSEM